MLAVHERGDSFFTRVRCSPNGIRSVNVLFFGVITRNERYGAGRFKSGEGAVSALRKLKAFSHGGIENVMVSAARGGYIFQVRV